MKPTARYVAVLCLILGACGTRESSAPVEVTIPEGAGSSAVADSLAARGVISHPRLFRLYARLKGADRHLEAGRYVLSPQDSWNTILTELHEGRVVTVPVTIPEGFRLDQIAERIVPIAKVELDSVMAVMSRPGEDSILDVPGPGLEGYLFPDTYLFAPGVPVETVLEAMAARYRAVWTPERVAARDSLEMTEREVVTLASIIQAEARHTEEMPLISAVYHNRLERHMLLQADPTVLYALGGPRERLLFAAIDSVADDPYNTYTHGGLPPGPIGAPGEAAIDAALHPADESYLYFVARPDGSHVFTHSLAEHNRAKAAARRAWDSIARERQAGDSVGGRGSAP